MSQNTVGARPGTLSIPEGSPPPRVYVTRYDATGLLESRELDDLSELERYHAPDEEAPDAATTWIDVRGLGDAEVLEKIGASFGLHPLVLEDAVNIPQRAKTEVHTGQHQLFIARLPLPSEDERHLEVPQVCILFTRRFVLTFQERYFGFFDPVRERIRAGQGAIWKLGGDYLAYALIDVLTDLYFPVIGELQDELEDLEEASFERPDADILVRLHRVRRWLSLLRRIGEPEREATQALLGPEHPFVSDEVQVFLRDTADHIAQALGRIESAREFAISLSELNLSSLGHRSNEIMKVLTLMASIFIPLSFIAGVYGMNFEYMPELKERSAYFLVLGLMGTIASSMIVYFWHRGWIDVGRRRTRDRRTAHDPKSRKRS